MTQNIDLTKTIEQLENFVAPEPTFRSGLVMRLHHLRKVRICDYSIGDLRVTIGQKIHTEWFIPLAIQQLEIDPLAEGDFYDGDLLCAVLKVPESYWQNNLEQKAIVLSLVENVNFKDKYQADILLEEIAFWLKS